MSPLFIRLVNWAIGFARKAAVQDGVVQWEYIPEGWAYADAHPEVKGWNVEEVLEIYKKKWPRFVAMCEGKGPLGISHESDLSRREKITAHNTQMSYGYVLALAASGSKSLSILDWGGGIGHYLVLAKALMPGIHIDYHCKDVPLLVEHGKQLFPDQHFYSGEECLDQTYDLVMASTSLHYSEDWQGTMSGLARAMRRYLYIASIPIVRHHPSFVFIQRPYEYGYNTEYLGWCLNHSDFLAYSSVLGLELIREFAYGHAPVIHGAPEQSRYRGYLFCR